MTPKDQTAMWGVYLFAWLPGLVGALGAAAVLLRFPGLDALKTACLFASGILVPAITGVTAMMYIASQPIRRQRQLVPRGLAAAANLSAANTEEIEVNEAKGATISASVGNTPLFDFGVTPQIQAKKLNVDDAEHQPSEGMGSFKKVTLETRVGRTKNGDDAISISIGKESITLDAAQSLSLIQQLVVDRAKMQTATPYERPRPGEQMSVIRNPETTVNHSFMSSSIIVSFRHPGLGRLSFSFSKEVANAFHKAIGNQLADLVQEESSDLQ